MLAAAGDHIYVDVFVADLICAPTLLELGVFPDGKELAESMATYAAVRAHMFRANPDDPEDVPRLRSDDKSITGIFVGDGWDCCQTWSPEAVQQTLKLEKLLPMVRIYTQNCGFVCFQNLLDVYFHRPCNEG